jgi:hypothetical protein
VFLLTAAAMGEGRTTVAATEKINIGCLRLGIRGFNTFRHWLKMPDVNVVAATDLL